MTGETHANVSVACGGTGGVLHFADAYVLPITLSVREMPQLSRHVGLRVGCKDDRLALGALVRSCCLAEA